ncbi:MAG: Stress response protein nst1 [Geoglossum umbratile]|nr:MAG: Stress response protein nst1 [Geoglossum umbratile]
MPSNQQRANGEPPTSPSGKGTATYSNKDGSKFITVRKPSGEMTPVQAGNQTQQTGSSGLGASSSQVVKGSNGSTPGSSSTPTGIVGGGTNGLVTGGVNRKKQKRRQKQAARLAAEQQVNGNQMTRGEYVDGGHVHHNHPVHNHNHSHRHHHVSPLHQNAQHSLNYEGQGYDHDQFEPADGDDVYFSEDEGRGYHGPGSYSSRQPSMNGHTNHNSIPDTDAPKKKSKKKKKSKTPQSLQQDFSSNALGGSSTSLSTPSASQIPPPPPPPPPPPLSSAPTRSSHTRDRIWNTSTQEERERIKDFWLSLGEEDRRSLVKVEKEAVLRKMKEQQKHSCSCTVCGRKRTAIEEELEVLYDAYYEELEQYANQQQGRLEDGAPMMPPPRKYGPMGRIHPGDRLPPIINSQQSARGRIEEPGDEDEDDDEGEGDDEDYSEDEEDYSDDEPDDEPRGPAADFFNFGNSLTVQGGILTVADDLLKNDGKKFIEMMEQLAERRMQREEEAQYAASGIGHPSMNMAQQHNHAGHNHGPHPDDEDYEDDEEDDYDSQDDEDYDDDEMDTMTEEQRMEEGRRMFQIFAARMFEQRVLTAYREKVAQERQQKLLEELEEESRLGQQREQKKAKEAQKKKDKKRQQKQAKEEERAKREAEKAAEELAAKAIEEKKAEEQRRKKEEQRKKREAERKAQEEERLKKEAEKQRRLQEERERQAELERKQREQKEREKKKREEAKRKEREEKEAREKEAKERREKEERERKEREAKARIEKEVKERAKKDEQAAQQAAAHAAQIAAQGPKRTILPISIPLPPGIQNTYPQSGFSSPHLHIATPAIPKAPAPARPRQTSQQGSVGSSPKTPQILPGASVSASPVTPVSHPNSLGPIGPPGKIQSQPQLPLYHPQAASPLPSNIVPPGVPPPPGFPPIPPMGMANPPSSQGPPLPGMSQRAPISHDVPLYPHTHQQPPIGTQYRGFVPPNGMPLQPGANVIRPIPQGRGMYMEGAPALPQQMSNMPMNAPGATYAAPRDTMPSHSHARQQSASMDKPSFENPNPIIPTQPIARPTPIQRPSSVAPQHRAEDAFHGSRADVDDLSNHLGSSALLEDGDADDPFPSNPPLVSRRGSAALGPPRSGRLGFASSPFAQDPIGQNKVDGFAGVGNTWGAPPMAFGSPLPGGSTWPNIPNAGWSNSNTFGVIGGTSRPGTSRPVTVRQMVCQACRQLTASKKNGDTFHEVNAVLRQVEQIRPANEALVQMRELLDICETEGDIQNGGGFFTIQKDAQGRTFVKHEVDEGIAGSGGRVNTAPGEIGSPVPGSSVPVFRPFQPGPGVASPSGF